MYGAWFGLQGKEKISHGKLSENKVRIERRAEENKSLVYSSDTARGNEKRGKEKSKTLSNIAKNNPSSFMV